MDRDKNNIDETNTHPNDTENNDNIDNNINNNAEYKQKKKAKKKNLLSYIAVALIAALVGGLVSPLIVLNYMDQNGFLAKEDTLATINMENRDDINLVSAVAHNTMSSVVGITTVSLQEIGPLQQEVDGVGSGVIVDSDGYILTNSHVINNGESEDIQVLFLNGQELLAKVLWSDPLLDLAIIKVDETGLPAAKLGNSDDLIIGETVIAIGNPLGLEFQSTVTSGIVSGLNRSVNVQGNVMDSLIQTDASINPGNSGGPLLNGNGEVIGINTAKVGNGEGMGFAIPINNVKPVIEQVIENGSYEVVYMGIKGIALDIYERQIGIDLSADNGVVIVEVEANSPADKAGLNAGDVITSIDDNKVENMNHLKKSLYSYQKGDKAQLTIIRNGNQQNIDIDFSTVH